MEAFSVRGLGRLGRQLDAGSTVRQRQRVRYRDRRLSDEHFPALCGARDAQGGTADVAAWFAEHRSEIEVDGLNRSRRRRRLPCWENMSERPTASRLWAR